MNFEQNIERHLYSRSPFYFNMPESPCLVRKVRKIKKKFSLIYIYDIKFKINGEFVKKRVLAKKDENIPSKYFDYKQEYLEIYQKLKSHLYSASSGIFSMPQIYDIMTTPHFIIYEFIEGENCETILFKPGALLLKNRRSEIILRNIADLPFLISKCDINKLVFQKEIHNVKIFINWLKEDVAGGQFVFLGRNTIKKLLSYLEHAEKEIKDDSKRGLMSGDFQLKNIILGKDKVIYLVDFEPIIGPIFISVAQLITQIRNKMFFYPGFFTSGVFKAYMETIFKRCAINSKENALNEALHFYLIKARLTSLKSFFEQRKITWPVFKIFFEKDIAALISGRCCGVEFKEYFS